LIARFQDDLELRVKLIVSRARDMLEHLELGALGGGNN
jgi:hypothetical protein